MNFVSCQQMGEWTLHLIKMIPNQFDLIVGVPRSGLRLASLFAAKFGRPLTTPSCNGVWYGRYSRKVETVRSILICDDSISSGKVMRSSIEMVRRKFPGVEVKTAVVIAQPDAVDKVDYLFKIMNHPRMFEWNIAHGKWGNLACDMDGVICKDLPEGLVEHQAVNVYRDYIISAPAVFIPQYSIDTIVSCRMERWRAITEDWLARHGVKYRQLLLWDVDGPLARVGKHADYKINQIKGTGATYVFESDWEQATRINIALKLPVLCYDRMVMLGGNGD